MRKKLLLASILAATLGTAVAWWLYPRLAAEEYATFERPDGKFRVVVLRVPQWLGTLPGQASDAPGIVRLYDEAGRLLNETRVDMVQLVDQVTWEENRVHIKLVADWKLPE